MQVRVLTGHLRAGGRSWAPKRWCREPHAPVYAILQGKLNSKDTAASRKTPQIPGKLTGQVEGRKQRQCSRLGIRHRATETRKEVKSE